MKHRLALILPAYVIVYTLALFAAFGLRFEFDPPPHMLRLLWASLPLVLLLKLGLCVATGEWRRTFRYATLADVLFVTAAATTAAAILAAVNLTNLLGQFIPRSVILIDWGLTILGGSLLRAGLRIYNELLRSVFMPAAEKERAIVFRSDRTGIAIFRAVEASDTRYEVVGFADDLSMRSSILAGLPVLSVADGWHAVVEQLRAKHVLIPATVSGRTIREVLEQCLQLGVKTHVIPAVEEIVDGRYQLQIREVTISDLLRRKPAELDLASIRQYVTGRRVMVTGAAGSIGSELCRQLLALNPLELVLFDQSEFGIFSMEQEFKSHCIDDVQLHYVIGDVVNSETVARAMQVHRPEMVFHAAAYKHVPLMEENPQEAIRNNVLGTKTIVDQSHQFRVERFVLVSTDKAVFPSSVMGATKFVGEKYVQAVAADSHTRFMTVRFGNVLNSAGSVVPTFRRQIEAGGPITVTHPEMERFFMTIPEAVQLILQAGAIGKSGDVMVLEMGDPVKIVDLARDMIFLSGLKYPDDIDIVFTGIRPGEKLSEELFYGGDSGAVKVHDKIYCAKRHPLDIDAVNRSIAQLGHAVHASVPEALEAIQDAVELLAAQEHGSVESSSTKRAA